MANLSFTIKDIPEDLPLSFAMQHYHVELIPQKCENCGGDGRVKIRKESKKK